MSNSHKFDLGRLEKKVTDLSNAWAKLGDGRDLLELIKILHKPGWTTPAEFQFANAFVDAMSAHVNAIAVMKTQLLQASAAVELKPDR